jgi:hypothetical protein
MTQFPEDPMAYDVVVYSPERQSLFLCFSSHISALKTPHHEAAVDHISRT